MRNSRQILQYQETGDNTAGEKSILTNMKEEICGEKDIILLPQKTKAEKNTQKRDVDAKMTL